MKKALALARGLRATANEEARATVQQRVPFALPSSCGHLLRAVQPAGAPSLADLLAALPLTSIRCVPACRANDTDWLTAMHGYVSTELTGQWGFTNKQLARIYCGSMFKAGVDKTKSLLQLLKTEGGFHNQHCA